MSDSVDNRVVSLKFDNSGFSQKVSETTKQLQKLNDDLKLSGAEEGNSKLENFFNKITNSAKSVKLDSIGNEVDKVQVSFSKFEAFVSGMFMRLGSEAITFGTKFAKSLTVDNIADGYKEYELKMESLKTIMASNTKYSLGQVNQYLEELNDYADQTVYKFSDMTTAIGRFVSMGVDVKTAVEAIQGASSLTALTGGGASEAQRVMYNTSQALATGYMSLLDWRSMENARVSKQWHTQIIETMREMQAAGKLTEDASKWLDEIGDNYGAFREGLKEKFVTKDIIVQSLQKFSDETTELGNRAMKAAREVTTFTKLLDTVKEGVGSAWARVFERILGNYDQSKALWTDLNGWISSIVIEPINTLDKALEKWSNTFVRFTTDAETGMKKVVTARDELINGFKNVMDFISSALKNISSAWSEVFGKSAVEYLVELTIRFKAWTDRLKENKALLESIKSVAKSIFEVVKFVKSILVAVGNILAKVVWPIVKVIFNFIMSVGKAIMTVIGGIASGLSEFIGSIFGSTPKITKIQQVVEDVNTSLANTETTLNNLTSSIEDNSSALESGAKSANKYLAMYKELGESKFTKQVFSNMGFSEMKSMLDEFEAAALAGDKDASSAYNTYYAKARKAAVTDRDVRSASLVTTNPQDLARYAKEGAFYEQGYIFFKDANNSGRLIGTSIGDINDSLALEKAGLSNSIYSSLLRSATDIESKLKLEKAKSSPFVEGNYLYTPYGMIALNDVEKAYGKYGAYTETTNAKIYRSTEKVGKSLGNLTKNFGNYTKGVSTLTTKLGDVFRNAIDRINPFGDKVRGVLKKTTENIDKSLNKVNNFVNKTVKKGTIYRSSEKVQKAVSKIFGGSDKGISIINKGIKSIYDNLGKVFGTVNKNKTISIPGLSAIFGGGRSGSGSGGSVRNSYANSTINNTVNNAKSASSDIEKSTKTINSSLDSINNKSSDTINGIAKDADDLTKILEEADKQPDTLKDVGQKAAKKVEETLGKVVESSFKGVLKILDKESETIDMSGMTNDQKIIAAMYKIKEIFKENISDETKAQIKEIFTDIGGIFKELIRLAKEVFSILGMSFDDTTKSEKKAGKETNKFFDRFKMVVEKVHDFVHGIRTALSEIKLIDSETGELTEKGKNVKRIIDYIINTIKVLGGLLLLPFKIIEKIMNVIERLKNGESYADIFGKRIAELIEKVKTVKDKITGTISTIWSVLSQFFKDVKTVGIKKALDNLFDKIPDGFFESIGRLIYKIYSFKDAVKTAFTTAKQKVSEFFENWKKGGFKYALEQSVEGLPEKIQGIFDIIATKLSNLGERIKNYIENTSGKEFWASLGDSEALSFAGSIGKFLLDVIGAGIGLAFDALFKKYLKFVGLEELVDSGDLENMSVWDKLKVLFTTIFNGSLAEAMNNTGLVDFLKWLARSFVDFVIEKFQEIKTNIFSLLGIDKSSSENVIDAVLEPMKSGKSAAGLETITKGLGDVSGAIEEVDGKKKINWSKVLGIGGFTLVALKIIQTLRLLADSTAVGNIGSNLTGFIGNITKAFAGFAAIATLTTIIEFAAVVYILVKAMSYLAVMDTETIGRNISHLYNIMDKLVDVVGEIGLIVMILNGIQLGGSFMSMKAGQGPLGGTKNYFYSIAALIFGISAGLAMLIKATAALAQVKNADRVTELIETIFGKPDNYRDFGIFGKVMLAVGAVVALAGVMGIIATKAEGDVTNKYNSGTGTLSPVINIGNVSHTTKQSPLAAIGSLIAEMGKILIIVLVGYAGLVTLMGIVLKFEGGEALLERAQETLFDILRAMGVALSIIFLGLIGFGKALGNAENGASMLKEMGKVLAAIGYMLSSTIFSIAIFIGKLGNADLSKDEIGFAIATIITVFLGVIAIVGVVLHYTNEMANWSNSSDDGDKMNKILKAVGKVISKIVKPIKWIFAGIGLMMKFAKDLTTDQLVQMTLIIDTVFMALALIIGIIFLSINHLRDSDESPDLKSFENITKLLKSLSGFLLILMGGVVLLFGEIIAMMAISKDIDFTLFDKVVDILLVIFIGVGVIIGGLLAALMIMDKQRGGGEFQVYDKFVSIINAISIFLAILMGSIVLIMGEIIAMMAISKDVDLTLFNKVGMILLIIFAGIGLILAGVLGALILMNEQRGGGEFKVFDKYVEMIKAISLFLVALGIITAVLIGAMTLLALGLNKVQNPDYIDKAITILITIMVSLFVLIGELVAALLILSKNKVDPSYALKMVGILTLFLGAVTLIAVILGAAIVTLAYIFTSIGDATMIDKAVQTFITLMISIAGLIVVFAAAITVMSKLGVTPINMLAFAAAMVLFAGSMVAIAGAFMMMASVAKDLSTGQLVGIVAIFAAFILILTGIALVSEFLTAGTLDVILLGIAGALVVFAISMIGMAAAMYIAAAAFGLFVEAGHRLFDLIIRLPELLVPMTVFLIGFRRYIMPELHNIALDLIHNVGEDIRAIIDEVCTNIETGIPRMAEAVLNAVNGIMEAIRNALQDNEETGEAGLITNFIGIFTDIINGVADNLDEVEDALSNLILSFIDMIIDLAETSGRVIRRLGQIPIAFIRGMFTNPEGEERTVAQNIIDGFLDGMEDSLKNSDIGDGLKNAGLAAIKGIRDVFRISSPSKVMKKIGQYVIQGFAQGLGDKKETGGVMDTITNLADKVTGVFGSSSGSEGGILDGLLGSLGLDPDSLDLTSTLNIIPSMDEGALNDLLGGFDSNMDLTGMLDGMNTSLDASNFASGNMADLSAYTAANQNGSTDMSTINVTNMTQNNVSSTQPDAATQYRQSKNLIDASLQNDRANGFKPTNSAPTTPTYIYLGGGKTNSIKVK